MTIWKRLRNLWRLSVLEVSTKGEIKLDTIQKFYTKLEEKKPHQATIIKKQTPIQEFLNNTQND